MASDKKRFQGYKNCSQFKWNMLKTLDKCITEISKVEKENTRHENICTLAS